MNLYIEIDSNGNANSHPAFDDNLIAVFGSIPPHWEPFVRVERPIPNAYQVLNSEEPTYQKVNGVWTDVWALRDMTDDEKTAKQQSVKLDWSNTKAKSDNFAAWTFNETTCEYEAPIPMPTDGQIYFWNGASNTWIVPPPYPNDGKRYGLSQKTWTWVEIKQPPSANTANI